MRIVIADDHELVRDCIKSLLKDEENIDIVGEARTGKEVLEIFPVLNPDIILLDINMPEMDGWETMKELKSTYNFSNVIALSMLSQRDSVKKMMDAGAMGYLLKNSGKEEILMALNFVLKGNKYITPQISLTILNNEDSTEPNKEKIKPEKQAKDISKRELEVLKLVAEGLTNSEIAEKLFNSKRTIESHRRNLIEKTGTKNSAELIKYAISRGILS